MSTKITFRLLFLRIYSNSKKEISIWKTWGNFIQFYQSSLRLFLYIIVPKTKRNNLKVLEHVNQTRERTKSGNIGILFHISSCLSHRISIDQTQNKPKSLQGWSLLLFLHFTRQIKRRLHLCARAITSSTSTLEALIGIISIRSCAEKSRCRRPQQLRTSRMVGPFLWLFLNGIGKDLRLRVCGGFLINCRENRNFLT